MLYQRNHIVLTTFHRYTRDIFALHDTFLLYTRYGMLANSKTSGVIQRIMWKVKVGLTRGGTRDALDLGSVATGTRNG